MTKKELLEKVARALFEIDHPLNWDIVTNDTKYNYAKRAERLITKLEQLCLGLPEDLIEPYNPYFSDTEFGSKGTFIRKFCWDSAVLKTKRLNPKRFVPLSELSEK
ncbi:MAG: hypothetical protein WC389_18825 [Lutibacter sp.]|jgi:hypothetical protein